MDRSGCRGIKGSEGVYPADSRGWELLELHPAPYLLVDTGSGRVVRGNAVARALGLHSPSSDPFALDESGNRIEVTELVPALIRKAGACQGAEITWCAGDRRHVFRVFARDLPSADGEGPLAGLAFLEVTQWSRRRRSCATRSPPGTNSFRLLPTS